MNNHDYSNYWKPASRRELHLIRVWDKAVLKRRLLDAGLLIAELTIFYFFISLFSFSGGKYIWKIVLFYLILLTCALLFGGFIVYGDEQEFWDGRLYTRTVTCIGHTKINTRYACRFSLDIIDEAGDILKEIEVPHVVQQSVRHQERLLAVTKNPGNPRPVRLVPLKKPKPDFLVSEP